MLKPGRPSYMRPKVPCHGGCCPKALPGGGPGGGGSMTPGVPGALGYRGGGGGKVVRLLTDCVALGAPMGAPIGGGGGGGKDLMASLAGTCLWPVGNMLSSCAGGNPPRKTD
jgi:hypothetical protein